MTFYLALNDTWYWCAWPYVLSVCLSVVFRKISRAVRGGVGVDLHFVFGPSPVQLAGPVVDMKGCNIACPWCAHSGLFGFMEMKHM